MPFAYYNNLSKAQQAIYDASDKISSIKLPRPRQCYKLVDHVCQSLMDEKRQPLEKSCRALMRELLGQLEVHPVAIEILSSRPHNNYGELHGLYERFESPRQWPKITLWMRTAKKKKVVAPKTFLRTLLHELGHHLDFEMLELEDSFHTEGFYKRESSLFHQIKSGVVK